MVVAVHAAPCSREQEGNVAKTLNVGLVGHRFRSRARSSAGTDVALAVDTPHHPVLKVAAVRVCGTIIAAGQSGQRVSP